MGELYAIQTANLVSQFGERTALPVVHYKKAMLNEFDAVIYLGSVYNEPIPQDFLHDVKATSRPVMWIGENLWKLDALENMVLQYGFRPTRYNNHLITHVLYKNTELSRSSKNGKIVNVAVKKQSVANVTSEAVLDSGRKIPWSIQSNNFLYITEIPFNYVTEGDRYLVFCDLLFDLLDKERPERHRAIVRLEDISPISSPKKLRSIADMLNELGVPFTLATVPFYIDPKGGNKRGYFERKMRDAPEVISAINYMISKGGEVIVHGYTHQYEQLPNPYRGNSIGDYEFFLASINEDGAIKLLSPVPKDSEAWSKKRGELAIDEFSKSGIKITNIFEYPHYAGSGISSRALSQVFPRANHRGMYFPGSLEGLNEKFTGPIEQYFPYPVRDVFNWVMIPENMGHYVPEVYHGRSARGIDEMLKNARALMVVRDSIAGFFYHKIYGEDNLRLLINEMKKMGYFFVSTSDVEEPLMRPLRERK